MLPIKILEVVVIFFVMSTLKSCDVWAARYWSHAERSQATASGCIQMQPCKKAPLALVNGRSSRPISVDKLEYFAFDYVGRRRRVYILLPASRSHRL